MDYNQLFEQIKAKKSFLCVGLDSDIAKITPHLLQLEDPDSRKTRYFPFLRISLKSGYFRYNSESKAKGSSGSVYYPS